MLLAAVHDDVLRIFNTFTVTNAAHKEKFDEEKNVLKSIIHPEKTYSWIGL